MERKQQKTQPTQGNGAIGSSVARASSPALVVGIGNTRYLHCDTRLTSYEVVPSVGKLTRFNAELLPTGTVTWTTSTS